MPQLESTEVYDQPLPYNLEAEQSVLGAVLLQPDCLSRVLEILRPECFYRPQHQELFSLIMGMYTSAETIDFITVLARAKEQGIFPTDEDAKIYLTQLAQVVPSVSNVEAYANIVREQYYRRSLILAAREIIDSSQDKGNDAKLLLDAAEQKIFEIRKGRETSGLTPIHEIILSTYDQLQKLAGEDRDQYAGISTGYRDLDRILTGLNKSDLILIAARPAMGKTSFAMNIASNVALKANVGVAVFSLEMSKEQLVSRLLSTEALIQSSSLKVGNLSGDEWVRLAMAAQVLSKAPMYIDDTPGITIGEMKARVRRRKDIGLIVIDYLQLMSTGRRSENRVQEVSEITRNLKIMAKELDVPIITLSQLSRGPDSRSDHRPMLSDLRESGSIEQDADIVLFLYREQYYQKETAKQNVAECIVAKNRHGETATVEMIWDGQYTRFSGMEKNRDVPNG